MDGLFSSEPVKLAAPMIDTRKTKEEVKEERKQERENQMERALRTVYVGNLPVETSKKEIGLFFKEIGKVLKVWFRSVPTDMDSKKPKKAKVLLKELNKNCKVMNCYVLFGKQEEANKAVEMKNRQVFKERHLHVTISDKQDKDFRSTLFVGNLPYDTDEEELRAVFEKHTTVDYVRVVRDPYDYKCKGFGYVKLMDSAGIDGILKKKLKYKERLVRVTKAKKNPEKFKRKRVKEDGEEKKPYNNKKAGKTGFKDRKQGLNKGRSDFKDKKLGFKDRKPDFKNKGFKKAADTKPFVNRQKKIKKIQGDQKKTN